jgi:hypothetical protein
MGDDTMTRNRLTIAGIAAGITFAAGLVTVLIIPGLGGTSRTKDFTDFYDSSGRRGAAALLGLVLVVGTWMMIWLFTELRGRLEAGVRPELAHRLGIVGTASVMVGTGIELGPTMVQNNTDNGDFVGIPIAHAFAQAGAGVVIMGLVTCAAAVFLYGLCMRRSTEVPRWLGTFSIVVAVMLLGSFFAAPGLLLPVWAVVVGVAARPRTAAGTPGRTGSGETTPPLRRPVAAQ